MSDTDTVDIQKHNQNQATIRSKESNNPFVSFWLSNETTKKKFVKTGTLIMMLPGTMDRKQKQRKITRTTKCDSTQPALVKPVAEA